MHIHNFTGYPPFFDDDHVKLYEKILQCRYRFPSHVDAQARDLIKNLLMSDLSMRYGNLKNGVKDIRQHPWFEAVDWDKTWRLEIQPPYKPPLKHAGDTSNFDVYDENKEAYGKEGPDPYADKFAAF
jgi:serine/threonine protein kinase